MDMSENSTKINKFAPQHSAREVNTRLPQSSLPLRDSETVHGDDFHISVISSDSDVSSSTRLANKPSVTPPPNQQYVAMAGLSLSEYNQSCQHTSSENNDPPDVNSSARSLSAHLVPLSCTSMLVNNDSMYSVLHDSKSTVVTDHRRKRIPLRSIQSTSRENLITKSSSCTFQSCGSLVSVSPPETDYTVSSKRHCSLNSRTGVTDDTADDVDIWPHFPHSPKSSSPVLNINEISDQETYEPMPKLITNYDFQEDIQNDANDDEDWPNFPASPPRDKMPTDDANAIVMLEENKMNDSSFVNVGDIKTINTDVPSCSNSIALKTATSTIPSLPQTESYASSIEGNSRQRNELSLSHSSYLPPSGNQSSEILPSTSSNSEGDDILNFVNIELIEDQLTSAAKSANDNDIAMEDVSPDLNESHATVGNPREWCSSAAVDDWFHDNVEDEKELLKRERELVAAGVDPRRRDDAGATPAHLAAKRGCATTLAALLRLGADPSAKDMFDWRPLHYAARYNHSSCVALLTSRGAYVEARNSAGKTPLHVAAASCAREATRALLAAGADNRARDENGTTPLDVAHSVEVRRERLLGRLSGRFLSKKGFGHWTNWRNLLEKERKIRRMLDYVLEEW